MASHGEFAAGVLLFAIGTKDLIVGKLVVSALWTLVALFWRLELGRSILVGALAPVEISIVKIFDELENGRVEQWIPLLDDVHPMDRRAFGKR